MNQNRSCYRLHQFPSLARRAADRFVQIMPTQNQVGLIEFSNEADTCVTLSPLETTGDKIHREIFSLRAWGSTALYDAVIKAIDDMKSADSGGADRIKAVVVLSDGQDTSSHATLNQVVARIKEVRTGRTPILVIPVAYGSDADMSALSAIARASATKVQSGDPEEIEHLLEIISSYF